jgi:hypothetical protein
MVHLVAIRVEKNSLFHTAPTHKLGKKNLGKPNFFIQVSTLQKVLQGHHGKSAFPFFCETRNDWIKPVFVQFNQDLSVA